jgi:beta-carotene 3-hydroxylase
LTEVRVFSYDPFMATELAVALVTLVASEPLMALVHRFVFHGPLWCSHKSHHEHPTARRIVGNDLLWLWPLLASAAFVTFGGPVLVGVGLGGAAYVGAYIFAHDGVSHGRFRVTATVRRMTVFRVVAYTHRLHHRGGRDGVGATPFAVYLAALEYRWSLTARYTPPTKVCAPARGTEGGRRGQHALA